MPLSSAQLGCSPDNTSQSTAGYGVKFLWQRLPSYHVIPETGGTDLVRYQGFSWVQTNNSLEAMKALGTLAVAFACFVQCTLGGKPDGNSKSKEVIRGMTAVCYDPKDVCYFHPCQNGGTCSPPKANDDDKPYTCHCFLGFGGVNCEKRQGKSASWVLALAENRNPQFHCCCFCVFVSGTPKEKTAFGIYILSVIINRLLFFYYHF